MPRTSRPKYRGPDREFALAMFRDSVAEAAAMVELTKDEFLHGLAEYYRGPLKDLPDYTAGRRVDLDGAEIDYARLRDDDSYVVDYKFTLQELNFGDTIQQAEDWIAASPSAQKMLDRRYLSRFAGTGARSSTKPIERLFGDAARTIQIVPSFSEGLQARALPGERPGILFGTGLVDAFSWASSLVIGASVRGTDPNGITFRDLRQEPQAFIAAVDELRAILDLAVGTRAKTPVYVLQGRLRQIASGLQAGAQTFVLLHELAHRLVSPLANPHDEELKCDEFAAKVMSASGDENLILGLLLGLMILATVLRESNAFVRTQSHPRFGLRMDRTLERLDSLGVRPARGEGLLSPPTRLMEEAVFRTETKDRLLPNLAMRLKKQWDAVSVDYGWITLPKDGRDHMPQAYWGTAAKAILDRAVRLPRLDEDTRRTWWQSDGFRFMLFVVDPMETIAAAREALAEADLPGTADRDEMACDAALALLTFLGRNESPPRSIDALKAFHQIAASGATGRHLRSVRARERSYLEHIGAVGSQSGVLRVRTRVELEFSIPAEWY